MGKIKIILLIVIQVWIVLGQNTSLRFTQGNYAKIPVITELQNAEEVTLEIWYYEEGASGEENIIGNEFFGGNFEFYRDGNGTIDWGENVIEAPNQGQGHWYHIAGTYSLIDGRKLFINGVLADSCNDCFFLDGLDDYLTINRHTWSGGSSSRLSGYVEELRISTVVRYTENFDLPTFEFQNDEDTAGLWHFNNNLNDESGNGHHGTGLGTSFASNTPGLNEGILGCTDLDADNYDVLANVDDGSCEYSNNNYSLSINGPGQRIEVGGITIGNTYSLGSWVKFPLPETADGHNCLFMSESPVSYQLAIHSISREIGVYQTDTGGDVSDWWLSGYNIEHLSGWHFLSVAAENSTTKFYVDGSEVGISNFVISTPILRIGNTTPNYNDGTQYIGVIDDPAIWNYALSPEEFQNQMEIGLDGSEPGLVAYWDLNEGSGSIANDLSGNGYNGTIYNAYFVEETPQLISGCTDENANNFNASANLNNESCEYIENSNYSLQFNGSPSTVNLGFLNEFNDNGNLTLEAWVKLSIHNGNNRIFTLGGNGHMAIGIHLDGIPYIINVIGGNNGYEAVGNYPLELETWYHIVGIYDNPNNLSILYVNGEFQNSTPTPDAPFYHPNSSSSNIGSYYQPFYGSHFTGKIAGLLLSQNIKYSSEFNPQYPITSTEQMIGLWLFNEGTGTTVNDNSINSNNGTLSSTTWSTNVPILGCVDVVANNFNPDANFDDDSCEYDSNVPDPTIFTYGGEFDGKEYYISNVTRTFTNAVELCNSNNGDIISLSSFEENEFASNLMIDFSDDNSSWIGLNKNSGSWQWVTGETVIFTSWAPATNEPSGDGNCANINHDLYHSGYVDNPNYNENYAGYWNDLNCDAQLYFILELNESNEEVIAGCTDLEANNYIEEANYDDGSCIYPPTVSIEEMTIEFGEVVFNSISNTELLITNTGNFDLSIVGSTHVSLLQLVIDSLVITPNDTGYINIQLSAELEEMTLNDTLIMITNDPVYPLIEIPISALIVPNEHPIITNIEDVPNDQGGWVRVHFTRSYHDTDSLRNQEQYTVQTNYGEGWELTNSGSAFGEPGYIIQVNTFIDSSDTSLGLIDFRIIAGMEEGNFVSVVAQGYSVDNINPTEPVEMTLQYGVNDNMLNMDWQANIDYDLSHYVITQNNEIIATPEISEFNDEINLSTGVYNFSLKAIDIHGNESNSVEKEIYIIENELISGNNLIGLPGTFENDSSIELLNGLIDFGPNVYFMLGQGVGIFNTSEGWSGNLNNVQPHHGYWLNISTSYNWRNNPELGAVQNCENFETVFGNNLLSFRWGNSDKPILDALGGEAFATENFEFILGQGVGLFNTADGWSGNLNLLEEGKGYWVNISSSNLNFKWGFDNCADPDFTPLLMEEEITEIPDEYQFVQSTEQAFYLIKEIENIVKGDLILAYCGEQLVGSAIWEGEYTVVPVMGRDVSEQTEGFCEPNEVPLFLMKSFNSTGELNNLNSFNGDINGFSNVGVYTIDKMVLDDNKIIPTEWSLASAYPNPFNPVTTISFGVPNAETRHAVSLRVFDINGRLIETLIGGQIEAGFHTIEWNATGLPSGVYFFKMESGVFIKTQKVILMK